MTDVSPRQIKEEKLRRLLKRDPHLYGELVLRQTWTEDAKEVARALVEHRRVCWRASHSVSKTFTSAALINWFFDTHGPCVVLSTAPTDRQVKDLIWKEVRAHRPDRALLSPKSPRMERAPDWYAAGFTARDYNAFQGTHAERMLVVFDEAVGIDQQFFEAAEGMLTSDEAYWLLVYNPTDISSQAYIEEHSGEFYVVRSSALDHPNVERELRGDAPLIPAGVRLRWLEERVRRWCSETEAPDPRKNDFEFPPGSGRHYRPGPLFESRVMGLWPSSATDVVWSESVWQLCLEQRPASKSAPLEIGCDVARFGDDFTAIHVRRGKASLHHERHNGWDTSQTAGRIKELCRRFAEDGEDPQSVACKIDDTGVGGGVTDQRGGFSFVPVNSQERADDDESYPNVRSELWFDVADRAADGRLDLSRLDEGSRREIGRQVKAPRWKMDGEGRRVVEPKDQTKKRLKVSPDDADAMNLAYYVHAHKLKVVVSS